MKRYTVLKTFKYTEEVVVVAESRQEALSLANHTDGERNHDDSLYDAEIVSSEPVDEPGEPTVN